MTYELRVTNYELRTTNDEFVESIHRLRLFVVGLSGWIAGGVKSAHAPAILAFPAAVRVAGSTHFPFL